MKMMSYFNFTIFAFIMCSCGVKTENKNLTSKLIQNPLTQAATVKPSELDSMVRSITLIAYPSAKEIEGFSYNVPDEVFNKVFFSQKKEYSSNGSSIVETSSDIVKYGNRMPRGIKNDSSNEKKVSNLITQLVNIGDVRDKAYETFVTNEKSIKSTRVSLKLVDEKVAKELTFFKINDQGDYKNKLVLSKLDGYKVSKVTTKTCDQLISRRLSDVAFDLLTEDETNLLNGIVDECNSLSTVKDFLVEVDEAQKNLIFDFGANVIASESVYYNGKTYVTSMLDALRDHSGKTFLSTGVFKESMLDGTYPDPLEISTIELNDGGDSFKVFSLRLDFLGRGVKTYSLENGLIKNLRFSQTSLGEKVLHFELDAEDVVVKAKLGMTFMPNMGLRFIGDADFFFASGDKNRGVMKIEIDSLNDAGLVIK